ncbi:hypothetical protein AMTR_s00057p00196440 [Amborella trichopoda]|uniref:Uncharacterized protein n=1 Tax=Amborella trichopoda TaxID=13333 RepID=U5D6A7_AMBTC|nr:hypothetical protein AMTR_s00057p00196440 [Amborella trichopoda]
MRPQNYEDQLVSAVQDSTVMLAEALTFRQKWYPEVYNHVNNALEMLSRFIIVDVNEIEVRMEHLQYQVNEETAHDEPRSGIVSESSCASEDMASSTQLAVEELRRHNTRKKQHQPKRM